MYKELFLRKSINQTAIWYIFLVFLLQLSFVGQTGLLLSLSTPGHSNRYSKHFIYLFSLASDQTVFRILLCKLWS